MNDRVFKILHQDGLISDDSFLKLGDSKKNQLFSLHWELKTLLYLGVLLLTSGLSILVYKNIDSIGHQAILLFIAILCTGSFYYCFKKTMPFTLKKVESPNAFFDYILLLGCLSFLTFIAYLQFQYNVFGNRYGLATFLPMLVLFFCAYYFDNIGILCLAITNLAAWLGITVTPLNVLRDNDFDNSVIIVTGLALAVLLTAAADLTKKRSIKYHFAFTYTNFAMHIFFISCIAAMFHFFSYYLLFFLLLLGAALFFYKLALKERSFYFLLIITLYAYFGLSFVVIDLISRMDFMDTGSLYLGALYFIASSTGLVIFLIKMNKKIKSNDSI